MKKLLFVCVAFAASFLFSNNTNAQQKIGYFDEQLTLSLFPGIQKIDTLLNSFQNDSLRVEYEYRVGDFTRRDSIFKKDSATMPVKARELATRELNQLKYNLINWQTYAQQMIEAKTEQLLMPYKQRMFEALKLVIAEQKYTYVFNAQALSVYTQPPLLDNLSIRVAMKLKLPLTKEIEDAWKVATGSAAPANKK
ncbi:MAG: OmpH family outer membrane protein [Sediminibacterium sp.]|nr:OmpH family outer membrane protein [Sediminibacterium sp.]MDP3129357.1 OmpH family outer membrane protein [Sediminibacterium sp.]